MHVRRLHLSILAVALLAIALAALFLTGFIQKLVGDGEASDAFGWLVLLVVIPAVVTVIIEMFQRRCPSCNRKWALKSTGIMENKGWFKGGRGAEWRCRYCGHTKWRKIEEVVSAD